MRKETETARIAKTFRAKSPVIWSCSRSTIISATYEETEGDQELSKVQQQ